MIAVDTNVVAYLLLNSSLQGMAEKVRETDSHWIVPLLWRSEFRNILALYHRKNLYSFDQIIKIMRTAEQLFLSKEYSVDSDKILQLVASSKCSTYDCEFVALALDMKVKLVTGDKQILKEFPSVAISLEQIIEGRK